MLVKVKASISFESFMDLRNALNSVDAFPPSAYVSAILRDQVCPSSNREGMFHYISSFCDIQT